MTDNVICPYCECDVDVSDSYGREDGCKLDYECPNCHKEFEVTIKYTPTYYTNKIIYQTCKDCGKEFRYEGQSYPKPDKYSNLQDDDYIICKKCFIRESNIIYKYEIGDKIIFTNKKTNNLNLKDIEGMKGIIIGTIYSPRKPLLYDIKLCNNCEGTSKILSNVLAEDIELE